MGHVCEPPSIPNQQSWLCKAWAHRFFEIQRENLWFLLCVEVISVDTAVPEEHGIAHCGHISILPLTGSFPLLKNHSAALLKR